MNVRRMLRVAVVSVALTGVAFPLYSGFAQQDPTRTTTTDRDDRRDYGWIGLMGLAGLAGLLGNKREDRLSARTTATATPR